MQDFGSSLVIYTEQLIYREYEKEKVIMDGRCADSCHWLEQLQQRR
jgi:hypothetical protein